MKKLKNLLKAINLQLFFQWRLHLNKCTRFEFNYYVLRDIGIFERILAYYKMFNNVNHEKEKMWYLVDKLGYTMDYYKWEQNWEQDRKYFRILFKQEGTTTLIRTFTPEK